MSIALTTFNRAQLLSRAGQSVLSQTHSNLELVIADNASTDETECLCRQLARDDSRVRYICHPENRGMVANITAAMRSCTGEYTMMLGDDDWLDPDYVSSCLRALLTRPENALVFGRPIFHLDDGSLRASKTFDLKQEDPCERIIELFDTALPTASISGSSPLDP